MKNIILNKNNLIVILFVFCLLNFSFSFFNLINSKEVVVFDLAGTFENFQNTLSEKKIDQDLHHIYLSRFSNALEQASHEYSNDNNVVIVPTPAVISGATDITEILQSKIITTYQKISYQGE